MAPAKSAAAPATPVETKPAATPAEPKLAAKPAVVAKPAAKPAKKLSGAALAQAAILKSLKIKSDPGTTMTHTYVPSGSIQIDDLIGGSASFDGKGRVCPGYPRKRVTEIFGVESSGKTTAALQAIAEVQKQGGSAMFLDLEQALDHGYARKIGVSYSPDKLVLYKIDTLEEAFQCMYVGIRAGIDLIVVDSVAAMTPKKEIEAKIDAEASIGLQARLMSKNMPKLVKWLQSKEALAQNPEGTAVILINQTRATISTGPGGGGGNDNTTGGKAAKFYETIRLQFSKIRAESIKVKDRFTGVEVNAPFGNHTRVKVIKNKLDAKAGHTADIFIRFGQGIDELYSLIEAGVANKLIKKETGGWHEYKGQRFQGREKLRLYLKENPKVFAEIRAAVLRIVQATAVVQEEEELDEVDAIAFSVESMGDDDEGEAVEEEPLAMALELDETPGDG